MKFKDEQDEMKSYQFWNPNFIISVNKLLKDDPLVET